MARHKNANWNFDDQPCWEAIHAALLMDLRDELQKLNKVFACANFQDVPFKLARIEAATSQTAGYARSVEAKLKTISRKIPVRRRKR